jgi:hypothetical protein
MRPSWGAPAILLALLSLAPVFAAGPVQAQEAYSGQEVSLYTVDGTLRSSQGIGGWLLSDQGVNHTLTFPLQKSDVSGIFSLNSGIGNARNQAAVIQVDIIPTATRPMPVFTYNGFMGLENNRMTTGDAAYHTFIGAGSLTGGGIVAINQMSGGLNNQFTAVRISLGPRDTFQATLPGSFIGLGNSAELRLSNEQLRIFAAATNNEVILTGQEKATATVGNGAFKDFNGVMAVSQISGTMNQVMNNMRININMPSQ